MERHWKGRTVSSMLALLVLGCAAVSWAPRPAGGAVLPRVVINEVVTDPQRDWNDTAGGDGRAFVATPGVGTVSSSDEWLEVLNAGGEPVDLTGWRLEFVDSSPASMTVGTGSATLVWSDGSSLACLLPGGRLVVGNPAGSMNNDVRIVLRDDAGAVIDAVELGDDPEGDGEGDGAPDGAGSDGNASDVRNESVVRYPDGRDTGRDPDDFVRSRASILATNTAALLFDTVPPVSTATVAAAYSGSATISIVATDDLSGVASVTHRLDGVAGTGGTVRASVCGTHTLEYWATDFAGNVEPSHRAVFRVLPRIVAAGFSNPVAYDLRSLRSTRFVFTADRSACGVTLTLRTPNGPATLFSGVVPNAAGVPYALPAWDGKVRGMRLPTGMYGWVLTVRKSGVTATRTGSLLLSRVCLSFSGSSTSGIARTHSVYLVTGRATCTIEATSVASSGRLAMRVTGPSSYDRSLGTWALSATRPLLAVASLSGSSAVRASGLHLFTVDGWGGVRYRCRVVQ
jgi:hypothetical protein